MEPQLHINIYLLTNIFDQNFVEKFLANFYVDDNIKGDDCYQKTFEFYKKSITCMKDAGFEFHTNDPNLQTTLRGQS